MLSNDFFSIDAMVSVFKRGLAVFTLHENASMGCFSTASKSKCNLHIRAPFAGSYFFLLEFGLKFLHFATHMSFLLLSLFLFRKNVETNCSVVPITLPGMRLSQILSRARHMGRVCGYKYKINYRLNRQPITGDHL